MANRLQDVKLLTLAGGSVVEMFDKELMKVVEDIQNPNSDAKATRKITLTVTIKPDKNRQSGTTTVQTNSQLAPSRAEQTTLYFGSDGHVSEVNQQQLDLYANAPADESEKTVDEDEGNNPEQADSEKVTPITKR